MNDNLYNCYGPDCEKLVDFNKTGSFFCSAECKKNYNGRDAAIAKKSTRTVNDCQTMLKQWAAEKKSEARTKLFT